MGTSSRQVRALQQEVERLQGARRQNAGGAISSGCRALDALLPLGGFPRGAVVEWLGPPGGAAGTLALLAARQAAGDGAALVVLDRARRFYPPAAAAWGIDLSQLIVLHPDSQRETLWALDQVLRCRGVAAAWAPLTRLDPHSFRRLQLAAESSGCLGLLLRPLEARGDPSWAELQLVVHPARAARPTAGWRWCVELTRGRGIARRHMIELEMDQHLGEVREVPHDEPRSPRSTPAAPAPASQTPALPVAAALAPAALAGGAARVE